MTQIFGFVVCSVTKQIHSHNLTTLMITSKLKVWQWGIILDCHSNSHIIWLRLHCASIWTC